VSAIWYLYSTLSPKQMTDLEAAYERRLEEYAEEYEDVFDDVDNTPEVLAGEAIPPLAELQAAYTLQRVSVPPAVLAKYKKCKSVMSIDCPGDVETNPSRLLISTLRFLFTRAGEGALVFPNGVPLQTTEEMLAKLQKKKGLTDFDDTPAPAKAKTATKKAPRVPAKKGEKTPETRAVRISQALEVLMDDPALALDLRSELAQTPKLVQRYAALIVEEGPVSDAKAAKALAVSVETLGDAADDLDVILSDLRE